MAQTHIVKQGEHLTGIAHSYGFSDYQTVWNYPDNAALKQLRQNPNVLYPGDQVAIPDKVPSDFPRPTDQTHSFVVNKGLLELRLTLGRTYGKPIANTPCELSVSANQYSLTSDFEGKIKHAIPSDVVDIKLLIKDKVMVKNQPVPLETLLSIKVGHLDPVEEKSGQVARLSNLGYYRRPLDKPDDAEFESAVEEFQCEAGLIPVDGICGPATQAKLKQLHGC